MASKALKGLTVKIGGDTTELTKALDKVEKQGRDLSSELGQINKLLKFDPKNTELLAQKQEVLAEAIGGAEDKLKTLKEAEKQVQAQFKEGKVSEEQVRALQREIIATEGKLKSYKNEAKETADTVKNLGKESGDSADKLDKQADSADDAEDAIQKLGDGAENVAKVGLLALAGAVTAVAASIKSVVEETAEYRREMAKLDVAYTKSGHSSEAAYDTYSDLQSVLGESDQAVEAANFIAKLSRNEADLAKWTEICTGVYGEFGSSLPVEALMESANESAKVGQIAGNLADALNWAAEEGETFGVTLKENIDFTKLSDKELEKLTETQRAEYEARKAQYEEIEAYNQKVQEAASAEDFFNIALENCTTEQERQTLILETLSGKYSDSAASFKEANKEVIAQNQASEKLNAVWAKVGQKAAPIVTAFTEGLAELAEAFLEVIEDADLDPLINGIKKGFTNLSQKVLPKLIKALEWCADNFDLLKSLTVGLIAAMATKKITDYARALGTNLVNATKALTKSTEKQTEAQKKANAAAKANVYILLASAIIGVVTAINSYVKSVREEKLRAMKDAAEATYGLTEAEEKLIERIGDASDAFKSQREATDKNISATNAQFEHLGKLKEELYRLVDAQGKVEEKDRARVDFILGQLNDALGTEYTRVGDLVESYTQLKASIDEVMIAKQAQILLDNAEAGYAQAITERQQAEIDFTNAIAARTQAQAEQNRLEQEFQTLQEEWNNATWGKDQSYIEYLVYLRDLKTRMEETGAALEANKDTVEETENAYTEIKTTLEGYYSDIGQYETAQVKLLEGNTEEAKRILSDRGYYMKTYADAYGFESEEVLNYWELMALQAGVEANVIRNNWEKGTEGYTKNMVTEAEDGYNKTIGVLGEAYTDFKMAGEGMTEGMTAGIKNGSTKAQLAMRGVVKDIINAAYKEAQINSPSKRMIPVGTGMDEGLEVGLEKGEKSVLQTAEQQVQGLISAYDGLRSPSGMMSLNAITSAAASRSAAEMSGLASANQPILEKILAAIENGQVITLDGDALVGATADRMDNALGRRRTLASRGAI